jgi:hypothetical protein
MDLDVVETVLVSKRMFAYVGPRSGPPFIDVQGSVASPIQNIQPFQFGARAQVPAWTCGYPWALDNCGGLHVLFDGRFIGPFLLSLSPLRDDQTRAFSERQTARKQVTRSDF